MKKVIDYWPTAYGWGIFIWSMITFLICKYYPQDATWWKDVLLGLVVILVIFLVPTIWLPSPEKTEKEDTKKES